MILKEALIYAEFLDHFLTIIQDKEEVDCATLGSGFLRSTKLSTIIGKISNDNSYIPLSALIKAGLVDERGSIVLSPNPRAERIGLFFDQDRTLGLLQQLGINPELLTEVQQLVLVTCFQEAANRMLNGSFRVFAQNGNNIEDPVQQETVLKILTRGGLIALGEVAAQIRFNPMDISLTPESLLLIKRKWIQSDKQAESTAGIDISDEYLQQPLLTEEAVLPLRDRIHILDELIPSLVIDASSLSVQEQMEHRAKLQLLSLHCTILSMTLNDRWQVKAQWLQPGAQVRVGEHLVTLPHSISTILGIIARTMAQKHRANYCSALVSIQQTAQLYQRDWYTWGRNQLPFISSSLAVTEILNSVLAIDLREADPAASMRETPTVTEALTEALFSGLTLFGVSSEPSSSGTAARQDNDVLSAIQALLMQ